MEYQTRANFNVVNFIQGILTIVNDLSRESEVNQGWAELIEHKQCGMFHYFQVLIYQHVIAPIFPCRLGMHKYWRLVLIVGRVQVPRIWSCCPEYVSKQSVRASVFTGESKELTYNSIDNHPPGHTKQEIGIGIVDFSHWRQRLCMYTSVLIFATPSYQFSPKAVILILVQIIVNAEVKACTFWNFLKLWHQFSIPKKNKIRWHGEREVIHAQVPTECSNFIVNVSAELSQIIPR